jgi:hypothetical protein
MLDAAGEVADRGDEGFERPGGDAYDLTAGAARRRARSSSGVRRPG